MQIELNAQRNGQQKNLLVIVMSHSHTVTQAAEEKPDDWNVESVHFKTTDFLQKDKEKYTHFSVPFKMDSEEIDAVCLSLFGNEFNIFSYTEYLIPYSVGDKELGLTPNRSARHFVPRSMLKYQMQDVFETRNTFTLIESLHNQFKENNCFFLSPPPPIADVNQLKNSLHLYCLLYTSPSPRDRG